MNWPNKLRVFLSLASLSGIMQLNTNLLGPLGKLGRKCSAVNKAPELSGTQGDQLYGASPFNKEYQLRFILLSDEMKDVICYFVDIRCTVSLSNCNDLFF
jgi:hypothetical protein